MGKQIQNWVSLLCILLGISHLPAWGQNLPPRTLLPADNIPWQFDNPHGTVAIGDIHGDYGALITILGHPHVALINPEGHWIGGKKTLVLLGDINDRGPQVPLIYQLLMRLEIQAAAAGGRVIVVQSDHTVLVLAGFLKYVNREEYDYWKFTSTSVTSSELASAITRTHVHLRNIEEYMRFHDDAERPGFDKFLLAQRGNRPLAQWLRSFNAIVKVGDTLFVHGGLDPFMAAEDPAQINASVRAWASYFQDAGDKPPLSTSWTIGHTEDFSMDPRYWLYGPLWIRNMWSLERKHQFLNSLFKKLGVKRIVVGHTRTSDVHKNRNGSLRMLLPPEFEPRSPPIILRSPHGKIYMIDTAISRWTGKPHQLSALLIEEGVAIPLHIDTPIPTERFSFDIPASKQWGYESSLLLKEMARCQKNP